MRRAEVAVGVKKDTKCSYRVISVTAAIANGGKWRQWDRPLASRHGRGWPRSAIKSNAAYLSGISIQTGKELSFILIIDTGQDAKETGL